ncbi:MAG: efflux RND transporter periplasmic adaptor subunit [Bacteroidetes bacterium]|jgi:RND family efflux transporter MFP subunit|nr:efflux RND transporter periplasmic adaptor subunit [Bacteroidota bacterium]
MKKIQLLTIVAALLIWGCGQDQPIQQQIKAKKKQIEKLEDEIAELRRQLPDSALKKAAVPVRLKDMTGETFQHYIIAFGEVEAEDYAMISPEMPGQIKKIHVREGQRVSADDLLITLNTESVESSIKQIEANLELAEQTYYKQQRLWKDSIGSEMQYLQAKTNFESLQAQLKNLKAQLRMSQIRAPFKGYVNDILLKEGELATQMEPLVEVVNLSELKVNADISETYFKDIKPGQQVEVTFEAYPDMKLEMPIKNVSNVIASASRTFEIELNFKNRQEKIKPNMISTIRINDYTAEDAMVVPSIIIKQDINGKYIYKAVTENGQTMARKAYIETGLSYNDQTLVTEGISKGDQVIVQGYNLVNTGIPVEIK